MTLFTFRPLWGALALLALTSSAAIAQVQQRAAPAHTHQGLVARPQSHQHQVLGAAQRTNTTVDKPGVGISYQWSPTSPGWSYPMRTTYVYDTYGRVTEEVTADSATNTPSYKSLYTYNAQGQQTESLGQMWNGTSWENNYRQQSTFDANGNETSYLSQYWQNGAWQTSYGDQYIFTYNAANQLVEVISKQFQSSTGTYVNDRRETYTLTSGQISLAVVQKWQGNAWVNDEQYVDVIWHDAAKRQLASYRWQEWNGAAYVDSARYSYTWGVGTSSVVVTERPTGPNTWAPSERYSSSSDAYGNHTGYQEELWRNNSWVTLYGERSQLTYTPTFAVRRQIAQRYDPQSEQWENYTRINYSSFQTFIVFGLAEDQLAATSPLYPNPAAATDRVTLEIPDLTEAAALPGEVRNALGQVVQTFAAQPEAGRHVARLEASGLPVGFYMVRVPTRSGVVVKRLVRN